MIPQDTLFKYGATSKTFTKDEKIFSENDIARNYYQILKGAVKMSNFNDDGKEFIQGIFYKKQSFGEPPLFIDVPYPANAITLSDSEIILLPKEKLLHLLNEHRDIHLKITENLAKRLHYKAIIASEISGQEPMHRILRFFDYLKNDVHEQSSKSSFKIPYTRQQIADVLGLRVETVIRSIKNLEKKGEVKIISRKVYR
ncbi:cAMP-binding domain of CRP or a regulatory subunit of cAMP-dependent protein kinases [Tenacibaculum sp. MAR_2009_124]|uniref:Crp/Fnr family transcriptional regulator n=1 Tax=Tenacibaculum sp. MAR_2009_124 TaxID=1250059 RepID=UPI00089A0999|nr:Crp/Fnr family transcriptional regulator [Tenacibaculum sp. MAR_2009_124]SEB41861.1 cAMP-binding domain of CRP or a regulatory subunit of cAMP-dependent protein kinases [Tenacibaculum sp. MAR_2009_124]